MRRFWIPAAVALILAGSFFLPSLIAHYEDRQMIGKYTVTDGGAVSFESNSELGMIDRLKLLGESSIQVENGKELDADTAYRHVLSELDRLDFAGVAAFDYGDCMPIKSDVLFYVDPADPTRNMIAWYIIIEDTSGNGTTVLLDDETGTIFPLSVFSKTQRDNVPSSMKTDTEPSAAADSRLLIEPDRLAAKMADYYGLDVAAVYVIDKTPMYGYFILEMSDGVNSVEISVEITYDYCRINFEQ